MKGILLAGGSGTRLYPLTEVISKQLLPIYDKPMIYYPLSILMLSGIREILIISTPQDKPRFQRLLGDGKKFGIHLEYAIQESPRGIVEALLIGEYFIGSESCALILGDNIFYGNGLTKILQHAHQTVTQGNALLYAYAVSHPEYFGVVTFDQQHHVQSIEEKPSHPQSNYAITGLYFYPQGVVQLAKEVQPSQRNELEITTLNQKYLEQHKLKVEILGQSMNWFDAGTIDDLVTATNFVKTIENRQGINISSPEEIAYQFGWISLEEFKETIEYYQQSLYGQHLKAMLKEK